MSYQIKTRRQQMNKPLAKIENVKPFEGCYSGKAKKTERTTQDVCEQCGGKLTACNTTFECIKCNVTTTGISQSLYAIVSDYLRFLPKELEDNSKKISFLLSCATRNAYYKGKEDMRNEKN